MPSLWPRALRPQIRFHDLRHTAATLMLRAGVDPHRVQRVLRHSSITTTTSTYANLDVEDLREAVAKIGPQPTANTMQPATSDSGDGDDAPPPAGGGVPVPPADGLLTVLGSLVPANDQTGPELRQVADSVGAPGRSRTCGPRLRSWNHPQSRHCPQCPVPCLPARLRDRQRPLLARWSLRIPVGLLPGCYPSSDPLRAPTHSFCRLRRWPACSTFAGTRCIG